MDDVTRRKLLKGASMAAALPVVATAQQIVVTPDWGHAPLPGETVITSPCGALADIKTLVAGQSHAGAIRVAMVEGNAVELAKSLGLGGIYEQNPTPEYWDVVPELSDNRNLALVLGGNHFSGQHGWYAYHTFQIPRPIWAEKAADSHPASSR
jgi:hypothetical protein